MSEVTYWYVPLPSPQFSGEPCPSCQGEGVTSYFMDDKYEMTPVEGKVLLVDVFCKDCEGCGSAKPDHIGCDHAIHEWISGLELSIDSDVEDVFGDEDTELQPGSDCPSCHGHQWNPIHAFTPDGEDEFVLRVPCGCQTERDTQVQMV